MLFCTITTAQLLATIAIFITPKSKDNCFDLNKKGKAGKGEAIVRKSTDFGWLKSAFVIQS